MAFDLKGATPDTSLPTTGFIFGADSQAATDPSIYSTQAVREAFMGSSAGVPAATITTSQPLLNHAQTWNDAAVTFGGWKLNITDTASAAASLLAQLQVGGTDRFTVDKGGVLSATSFRTVGVAGNAGWVGTANNISFFNYTYEYARFSTSGLRFSTQNIGFGSFGTPDALIERVAAKVISIRGASSAAGTLSLGVQTVANLPAAATAGAGSIAFVSDATATTPRSTVAGTGANFVQVMSDGTNWLIVA